MDIKNDSCVSGVNTFGRDKGRNRVNIKTLALDTLNLGIGVKF